MVSLFLITSAVRLIPMSMWGPQPRAVLRRLCSRSRGLLAAKFTPILLNRGLAAMPRPVSALRQDVLRPEQSGFVRNRSACDSRRRLLNTRRRVSGGKKKCWSLCRVGRGGSGWCGCSPGISVRMMRGERQQLSGDYWWQWGPAGGSWHRHWIRQAQ